MTDAKDYPPWLRRVFPSITDVLFIYIFLILLLGENNTALFHDGDTGWHIRAGEYILAHGSVPRYDLFSHTLAGRPWFAWEWLSDIIFGWLHRSFGLNGLSLFSALIIAVTGLLLFKLILSRGANILVGALVFGLTMYASTVHWLARPHIVSWLFCLIYYWILDDVQQARARRLFLLPILMLLWINLHGGFLIGITLIMIYAGGNLVTFLLSDDPIRKQEAGRLFRRFTGCGLMTLLVTFCNPYGYHLHAHIYHYLKSSFLLNSIQEFASPDFHQGNIKYFEILLILALLSAARALADLNFVPAVLVIFWGHYALQSARHIPVFGIVAAPMVALNLTEVLNLLTQQKDLNARFRSWLSGITGFAADILRMERQFNGHALPMVLVLFFSVIICFSGGRVAGHAIMQSKFDPAKFPAAAADFLQSSPRVARGNLFNTDYWGGYLIYRFYPEIKVFIDGRSDAYSETFLNQYIKVASLKPGWQEVLQENHIAWLILPVELPLSSALAGNPEWTIAYKDKVAIIFTKREPPIQR